MYEQNVEFNLIDQINVNFECEEFILARDKTEKI